MPSTVVPSLVPLGPHGDRPAIPLARPVMLVGSHDNARLHLVSRSVSKAHCLIVNEASGTYIHDLMSRTHVIVNGSVVEEAVLATGDIIDIGSFKFRFMDVPGQETQPKRPPVGQLRRSRSSDPLIVRKRVLLIGRRPGSDIVLEDDAVSTAHAVIYERNGHRFVRDLGSRTGTILNGTAVHDAPIKFGDAIRIGTESLQYARCDLSPEMLASLSPSGADELEHLVGTAPLIEEAALALPVESETDRLIREALGIPAESEPPAGIVESEEPEPSEPLPFAEKAAEKPPAVELEPVREPEIDLATDPDMIGSNDTQQIPVVPVEPEATPVLSEAVVDELEQLPVEVEPVPTAEEPQPEPEVAHEHGPAASEPEATAPSEPVAIEPEIASPKARRGWRATLPSDVAKDIASDALPSVKSLDAWRDQAASDLAEVDFSKLDLSEARDEADKPESVVPVIDADIIETTQPEPESAQALDEAVEMDFPANEPTAGAPEGIEAISDTGFGREVQSLSGENQGVPVDEAESVMEEIIEPVPEAEALEEIVELNAAETDPVRAEPVEIDATAQVTADQPAPAPDATPPQSPLQAIANQAQQFEVADIEPEAPAEHFRIVDEDRPLSAPDTAPKSPPITGPFVGEIVDESQDAPTRSAKGAAPKKRQAPKRASRRKPKDAIEKRPAKPPVAENPFEAADQPVVAPFDPDSYINPEGEIAPLSLIDDLPIENSAIVEAFPEPLLSLPEPQAEDFPSIESLTDLEDSAPIDFVTPPQETSAEEPPAVPELPEAPVDANETHPPQINSSDIEPTHADNPTDEPPLHFDLTESPAGPLGSTFDLTELEPEAFEVSQPVAPVEAPAPVEPAQAAEASPAAESLPEATEAAPIDEIFEPALSETEVIESAPAPEVEVESAASDLIGPSIEPPAEMSPVNESPEAELETFAPELTDSPADELPIEEFPVVEVLETEPVPTRDVVFNAPETPAPVASDNTSVEPPPAETGVFDMPSGTVSISGDAPVLLSGFSGNAGSINVAPDPAGSQPVALPPGGGVPRSVFDDLFGDIPESSSFLGGMPLELPDVPSNFGRVNIGFDARPIKAPPGGGYASRAFSMPASGAFQQDVVPTPSVVVPAREVMSGDTVVEDEQETDTPPEVHPRETRFDDYDARPESAKVQPPIAIRRKETNPSSLMEVPDEDRLPDHDAGLNDPKARSSEDGEADDADETADGTDREETAGAFDGLTAASPPTRTPPRPIFSGSKVTDRDISRAAKLKKKRKAGPPKMPRDPFALANGLPDIPESGPGKESDKGRPAQAGAVPQRRAAAANPDVPSQPPPLIPRRMSILVAVGLAMMLCIAAVLGAIYALVPVTTKIEASLVFRNFENLNPAEQARVSAEQRRLLENANVRNDAQQILSARATAIGGMIKPGFLADPLQLAAMLQDLDWRPKDRPTMLVLSEESTDAKGDRYRIESLIRALYTANQPRIDENRRKATDLGLLKDEFAATQRQADVVKAKIAELRANGENRPALAQVKRLRTEEASLDKTWYDARLTRADLQTEIASLQKALADMPASDDAEAKQMRLQKQKLLESRAAALGEAEKVEADALAKLDQKRNQVAEADAALRIEQRGADEMAARQVEDADLKKKLDVLSRSIAERDAELKKAVEPIEPNAANLLMGDAQDSRPTYSLFAVLGIIGISMIVMFMAHRHERRVPMALPVSQA